MPLLRASALSLLALVAACAGQADGARPAAPRTRTLILGGYTTPREVYGRAILPAFKAYWKERTGETVEFQESYLGSGAQARAIAAGFEADVAALSLEPDIETLVTAGLVTRNWRAAPNGGMVSRSVVAIAVRPGNPKGIRDWDDLLRPGVEVLTPNPRTSGGAMWNVAALWGAALRGGTSAAPGDSAAAAAKVAALLRNVRIMDKGARESMITFETGVGDAAVTYENEVLVSRRAGTRVDCVIPRATILIENPVAVVDAYASKHGTLDLADAFVRFLATPAAQRAFASYGLRPVDARGAADTLPAPAGLFTIRDLGGWPSVTRRVFAPGGVFDRAGSAAAVASAR